MTQPVYDPAVIDRFLADIKHLKMPVLVGLLPLPATEMRSSSTTRYWHVQVPQSIRDRCRVERARWLGVKGCLSPRGAFCVKERVAGCYIMPPFGRVEAIEIFEVACW